MTDRLVVFKGAMTLNDLIDSIVYSQVGEVFAWLSRNCELQTSEIETSARLQALGSPVLISGLPPQGIIGHCTTLLTALIIVHKHTDGDWGLALKQGLLTEVQIDTGHYIFKENVHGV
jgi:hypothetical protein